MEKIESSHPSHEHPHIEIEVTLPSIYIRNYDNGMREISKRFELTQTNEAYEDQASHCS